MEFITLAFPTVRDYLRTTGNGTGEALATNLSASYAADPWQAKENLYSEASFLPCLVGLSAFTCPFFPCHHCGAGLTPSAEEWKRLYQVHNGQDSTQKVKSRALAWNLLTYLSTIFSLPAWLEGRHQRPCHGNEGSKLDAFYPKTWRWQFLIKRKERKAVYSLTTFWHTLARIRELWSREKWKSISQKMETLRIGMKYGKK